MNAYYKLGRIEDDACGVGFSGDNIFFDKIGEGVYCDNWEPVHFVLRDGGFCDYQTNDLDWPLCSKKLRNIINKKNSMKNSIQWLNATITDIKGEKRPYYILHIPKRADVLDKSRTIYAVDDIVMLPVFSLDKIENHQVFSYPGGEFSVFVSEEVKVAICLAECTGIEFREVDLS